ncbi:MAG: hypothetical protein GXO29_00580, partial [Thermotogae bacterium]|nr:hypothetical protein [Thermotogota bacterium]
VPYILVVGRREAESGTVSVRRRKEGDLGSMSLQELLERMREELETS